MSDEGSFFKKVMPYLVTGEAFKYNHKSSEKPRDKFHKIILKPPTKSKHVHFERPNKQSLIDGRRILLSIDPPKPKTLTFLNNRKDLSVQNTCNNPPKQASAQRLLKNSPPLVSTVKELTAKPKNKTTLISLALDYKNRPKKKHIPNKFKVQQLLVGPEFQQIFEPLIPSSRFPLFKQPKALLNVQKNSVKSRTSLALDYKLKPKNPKGLTATTKEAKEKVNLLLDYLSVKRPRKNLSITQIQNVNEVKKIIKKGLGLSQKDLESFSKALVPVLTVSEKEKIIYKKLETIRLLAKAYPDPFVTRETLRPEKSLSFFEDMLRITNDFINLFKIVTKDKRMWNGLGIEQRKMVQKLQRIKAPKKALICVKELYVLGLSQKQVKSLITVSKRKSNTLFTTSLAADYKVKKEALSAFNTIYDTLSVIGEKFLEQDSKQVPQAYNEFGLTLLGVLWWYLSKSVKISKI